MFIWVRRTMRKMSWKKIFVLKELLDAYSRTNVKLFPFPHSRFSHILYIPAPSPVLSHPILFALIAQENYSESPPSTKRQSFIAINHKHLSSILLPSSLKPPKATAACRRPAKTKKDMELVYTHSAPPTARKTVGRSPVQTGKDKNKNRSYGFW